MYKIQIQHKVKQRKCLVVVNDRGCNVSKSLHFFDSKGITGCCNSIVSEPPRICGKPRIGNKYVLHIIELRIL